MNNQTSDNAENKFREFKRLKTTSRKIEALVNAIYDFCDRSWTDDDTAPIKEEMQAQKKSLEKINQKIKNRIDDLDIDLSTILYHATHAQDACNIN